jgi:hypothetical protein
MDDLMELENFHPGMQREELLEWFRKRLGRAPEALDFYRVSRLRTVATVAGAAVALSDSDTNVHALSLLFSPSLCVLRSRKSSIS